MNSSKASLMMKPTQLSLMESVKWAAFRVLERLSDLRGNAVRQTSDSKMLSDLSDQRTLWVFVSTIGELNAIDPFLRTFHAERPQWPLVLITDHDHYRDIYQARYPDATVFISHGHSKDAEKLANRLPPALLVVAEIPCLPSDAPCRFAYAFLYEAKKRQARVLLVNGWLYHYQPSCRMDAVENRFFRRHFVRLFDVACVQNEEVRECLLREGAEPERVVVTGNVKFDALSNENWSPAQARSPILLSALLASGRVIIVAGCVTGYDEQKRVLDAFVHLREHYPNALLVLGPRHPEVTEHMVALKSFLNERSLTNQFRSCIDDIALSEDTACLVLDTIGELRDFYAAATLAYVGVDHNVLEPLSFLKPVTVSPGWESTYPSYPVYCAMLKAGGVLQVESDVDLVSVWLKSIEEPCQYEEQQSFISQILQQAMGATERCLSIMQNFGKSI